ncbi:NAD(P)-binding protein [Aspergillus steynii IBT 23096]|uniref:NAD(P)-binding protein n=1 Tax=Aspergillus steynii IBT 23096 TaxID=1392250 RepID=A0A2I2G855_9EURO|nr:NAD(P)-binding protein [Aspergillus steynii IBT 23096]PLB49067.1 NAD(P)-binding protein [Aspergillus steynii IBT 23096]
MFPPNRILVTCAAGNQGRGVVHRSLAAGHHVYAYVRDPTTPAATQLEGLGAKLVKGDLGDIDALRCATEGIDVVFHTEVQTGDWAGDLQRSTNVIDAARASSTVSTMIVSTAIKVGQHETFPGWGLEHPMRQYWLNKHALESQVREAGFQHWTIIRPGHFLQNLKAPVNALAFPDFVDDRVLRVAWRPDTKLPWVDAADVGIVVAKVVSDPECYTHQEIDLAVEALTVEEVAGKLTRCLGREVKVHYLSDEEVDDMIKQGSPVPAAHKWANEVPGVDAVGKFKELDLTPVDAFLETNATAI